MSKQPDEETGPMLSHPSTARADELHEQTERMLAELLPSVSRLNVWNDAVGRVLDVAERKYGER